MKYSFLFFSVLIFLCSTSCSSNKKNNVEKPTGNELIEEAQTIVPDSFALPSIPNSITQPNERSLYLSMHYWDRFDFKSEKLVNNEGITEQAFLDYINVLNYVPKDNVKPSLAYTIKKAEADSAMFAYFVSLFDKYLHHPNSPFRNEEFYIPALELEIASPLLSDVDKSKYQFQLEMALKNRVGQNATDFTYTLASGTKSNLYSLKSEYVLLFFFDPDCHSCEAAIAQFRNSQIINNLLGMNMPGSTILTILSVDPLGDINEWKKNLKKLPDNWIKSYDAGKVIINKNLYDIPAYPTIYLLDKDKKVVLKDVSADLVERFFANHQ